MIDKKVKILQVIDRLSVGGAEQITVLLTNLLFKGDYDVSLLLLMDKGELFDELDDQIPIIELSKKSNLDFKTYYKCYKIIKNYDVIHVHMRHNYKFIRVVKVLFGLKAKVILHDHFGSIETDKSIPTFFKVFKPRYYIGVSKSLIQWALSFGVKNSFLLQNTISKKKTIPSKIKVGGFVNVANIKPIKNQLFALELAHFLEERITFYGNIQDKAYYEVLINKVNELKMNDKVRFIHNNSQIQSELNQYDAALHTALSESGPLVLIEYLAQEIPFLSYKTGEVARFLENELPESIISNFELNLWKEQMEKVKKEDLSSLGELYNKFFSPENYFKSCLNIYKNVIN